MIWNIKIQNVFLPIPNFWGKSFITEMEYNRKKKHASFKICTLKVKENYGLA